MNTKVPGTTERGPLRVTLNNYLGLKLQERHVVGRSFMLPFQAALL